MNEILLEVDHVKKYFPFKKFLSPTQQVKAVDGVSFKLRKGKTIGIVGESGCGKSTLAKLLLQLEEPTSGQIKIMNQPLDDLNKKELCQLIQMVFQDPYSSNNPHHQAPLTGRRQNGERPLK